MGLPFSRGEWNSQMKIISYEGIDGLRFGESSTADAIAAYGEPLRIGTSWLGTTEYYYEQVTLRFDTANGTLRDLTLLPYADGKVNDIRVTWDKEFLRRVCRADGSPCDALGFILCPKLGIMVTGIHDDDRSQLALSAFSFRDRDKMMRNSEPFDVSTLG
jgi:hypothetical protein